MGYRIGELARMTGTSAPTIRYYETIGLLPPPHRRAGGQRDYGDADVRRVTFVRHCRGLGFSIAQTRTLAALVRDRERSCLEARHVAAAHLAGIRARLAELLALERGVAALLEAAETACTGGPGADCAILAGMAEPKAPQTAAKAGP